MTKSLEVRTCNTTNSLPETLLFTSSKIKCTFEHSFLILENEFWALTEAPKTCVDQTDEDIDAVEFMTIDNCSNNCNKQTRMFAYGTNDFGGQGCNKDGLCKCHCIATDENDITCTKIDHQDYWFFKFKDDGMF